MEENEPRRPWKARATRDGILFTVGLLGVIHETLVGSTERPDLLLLFAAMIGLPAYLRINGK